MKKSEEKKNIFGLIGFVIFVGMLVPFACQFVIPLFWEQQKIQGVEIWNQFVSIVLGIVATNLSIISLKMGFDSADNAKNTEMKTQGILDEISSKISLLTEKQNQMAKSIDEFRNTQGEHRDINGNSTWAKSNSDNKENNEI